MTTTTELTTTGTSHQSHPEHRMLVALSPADVPSTQAELKGWCQQKIAALTQEQSDLLDNARVAKSNNWSHGSLSSLAAKTGREIAYYQKVLAAVDAGYLIVPNFDVEVMAIRVQHNRAPTESHTRYRPSQLVATSADLLPVGDGQYVNPMPVATKRMMPDPTSSEPNRKTLMFVSTDEFKDLQFPVAAVKPVVLEATHLAMSKRIFDQIGVVTGRKQDPLVIGTIFDPRDRYRMKRVSFFVAWWFDTRSL